MELAEIDPVVAHYFSGGVYAKEMVLPAGHVAMTHRHHYDHLSILASGTAEIEIGDVVGTMTGPAVLTISANRHHGIRALTDTVWYCIHRTDVTDPDLVDAVLIAKGE